MKRLFITTGSISLVNILTVINTTEQDTLIILSFRQSDEFKQTQLKIASLHKFEKILFFKKEREVMRDVNIFEYDEVYSVTASRFYKLFGKHPRLYMFDEGPGYAISDMSKVSGLKRFYATKFLDKFDVLAMPENAERVFTDKEKFLKLSDKIITLFNEPVKLPTKRNILFIGHYMYHRLGEDYALDFYKKYIDKFIKSGYNVYFKAHPREESSFLPLLEDYYASPPPKAENFT